MSHNFKFGNLTDVGLVRQANEDYYGCFDTPNGFVFVVCDGMGGHVGGAIASQTAVEAIKTFYDSAVYENIIVSMQNALSYANNAILNKITESPELEGMGTTAVLLNVKNDKVYYAHIGDSRIYYLHKKNLYRITRDHSIVQGLVDDGHITEAEAEKHPKKNQITKALGIHATIEATICNEPILPVAGDSFLLCSDGLTGMISDHSITQIISNEKYDLPEKVAELIRQAKQKGGLDNITAQMLLFDKTSNSQSNFDTVAPAAIKNSTISKGISKRKFGILILGFLIALAALFGGYKYFFATKNSVTVITDTIPPGKKATAPTKENPATESEDKLSDDQAETEASKYDKTDNPTPTNNPADGGEGLPIVKKQSTRGSESDVFKYTIQKGDNDAVMKEKFKKSWELLKKDDPSYTKTNPEAGETIKVRVKTVYTATSEKEMEENIKNAIINFKVKRSDLIILTEQKIVLVPNR